MEKASKIKQILFELEFDEKWFDLEFVSSEKLEILWRTFQISDDKNKEHYRWRTFNEFLKDKKDINENDLRELYYLGEIDKDSFGMGMSMRIAILKRNDCPDDLTDKALNSDEKPLVKVVQRKLGLENK